MIRWAQHTLVSLRSQPPLVFVTPSQVPSFRSLHRLMPCQSLNTWYRQVQETKGEVERSTGQRDREKIVREDVLEVAVLELGLEIGEWELFRLKGRVGGKAD